MAKLDLPPCARRGPPTGGSIPCRTCTGSVRLALWQCSAFGACTAATKVPGYGCCKRCPELDQAAAEPATVAGSAEPARFSFTFP